MIIIEADCAMRGQDTMTISSNVASVASDGPDPSINEECPRPRLEGHGALFECHDMCGMIQ
jgi:hypothetical protein